jgi:hypothetical protein
MTLHEFIVACDWKPPCDYERILSLTQMRDAVVVVTDAAIYRAEWQFGTQGDDLRVVMLAHL